MYLNGIGKKYGEHLYLVFRVLVGLLFFMHGSGKLLGWFGGPGFGFSGPWLMVLAGSIEFLAGLGILLGFFTRLSALGGLVVMVGALATVHFPQGYNPLANGGELATLFLAAFLVLLVYGAQKWSLEKQLLKKELF